MEMGPRPARLLSGAGPILDIAILIRDVNCLGYSNFIS